MKNKLKLDINRIPTVLFLFVILLLVVVPIFWVFISAVKPEGQIISYPPTFFADSFTLANFAQLTRRLQIWKYTLNSVIYALASTLPAIFINSLAGYAFARYNFKGKNVLFIMTLATLMVPFQVIMVPLFLLVFRLGMYDTYWGLILPKVANALFIFMMRSVFVGMPKELEESGRIDGLTEFGIFWRIMLPQCKASIVTIIILGINAAWNDLMWPLLVTSNIRMRTLANGLALFVGTDTIQYGAAFAGAVVSILPMLLLYLFGQKYFVAGVITSGLKG